ncbi:MAG: hypothetical protein IJ242_15730 [Clostridia bacterium]|nr:hypothetical protein [Clostridia bacterium]
MYRKSLFDSIHLPVFGKSKEIQLPILTVLACLACAALWTALSGIGGFFYQNDDFYGRNAIFHDLLNYHWPVHFPGTEYALTYYIGYWMVPSLLGKITSYLIGGQYLWELANIFLYLETVWFLFLIFLLFLTLLDITKTVSACFFLLVFVMFSGMDGLACYFLGDWTDQIEWWAQTWQFSSFTTCLFWVFNQAVPAWLATLLLLTDIDNVSAYALIGLSVLPFAPLPLTGLAVLCIGLFILKAARSLVSGRQTEFKKTVTSVLSPCNLLSIIGSIPVLFYLLSNESTKEAPFRFDLFLYAYSLQESLLRLMWFSLVEWAIYALLLIPACRHSSLFLLCSAELVFVPMFRVGYNMDFSMRASIPALLVLCVLCSRQIRNFCITHSKVQKVCTILLVIAMLIGAITPLLEFERGAYNIKMHGFERRFADPFGTVLHPDADTANFICRDTTSSFFYQHLARNAD